MAGRALASVALFFLFTGCPFLIKDDYFIDETDGAALDAGARFDDVLDDVGDCKKKGPCHEDECHTKDCENP
jgi:hypothetical protein